MEKRRRLIKATLWLLLSFVFSVTKAQQVDISEAKQIAADFLNQQPVSQLAKARGYDHNKTIEATDLRLADSREDSKGAPAVYVFNTSDNHGYVIASAEKQTESILGYSHVGNFNPDSLPCCLKYLLDSYARQIAYARENPSKIKAKASTKSSDRAPISPLLTSQWDQHAPYNNNCPVVDGQRCLTGCVATAIAQVLYYHKWPERSQGGFYSYEWNGQTLGTVFGEKEYRYDKMKDTYDSSTPSDDDKYVAELMWDCGVSVNMNYGKGVSSAYVEGIEFPMFFDYYSGYWNLWLEGMNQDNVLSKIYNELSHRRPLLFSGSSYNGENGHEFVCDGYAEGDYLHFNFGWGGYSDDYFLISAITPYGNDFRYNLNVIGGLVPMRDVKNTIIDGVGYELIDEEAFLADGAVASGNYVIPQSISVSGKAYPVRGIGSKAFKGNSNIASVVIPASIESVSDSVFAGCINMIELIIEDSESLLLSQWDSFYDIDNVNKVYLGRDCSTDLYMGYVMSLTIGAGVSEKFLRSSNLMGYYLKEIQVTPDNPNLSTEDNVLFDKNKTRLITYLRENNNPQYVIPSSVKTIESEAFSNNVNLVSVCIPSSVEEIEKKAFEYCFYLSDIQVDPDNKHFVFDNHTLFSYDKTRILLYTLNVVNPMGIKVNYEMPHSVKTIDDYAFYYADVSSLSLSKNLYSIGEAAFMFCGNEVFESVTVPSSLAHIDNDGFSGINAKAIYVEKGNSRYSDTDGVLFETQKLLCMPAGRTGDYKIPDGVVTIGRTAFYFSSLSAVYIPSSVVKIDWCAFFHPKIDSLIVESDYPAECDWDALYYFYQEKYIDGQDWVYHEPCIFVPQGSLELYQTAMEWGYRSNYYEMTADEMSQWILTNDIKNVKLPSKQYPSVYYDLRGNRLSSPKPGINIMRTTDGKYKKIIIK